MNGQLDSCHCCEGLTAQTDITRPALQNLKTRDNDDFSIALLDAAATMADVLTFYQERIANESYMRTATERRSLLELARLIGYELRPGVAANTLLAFTMDDTPGAPLQTTVDIGTKVQSIPGPDEKPQTFETVEKITTRVEWAEGLGTTTPHVVLPSASPKVYALRLRASLFGFNAPNPKTLSNEVLTHYGQATDKDWPFSISGQMIDLDQTYPGILAQSWLVLSRTNYQELYRATTVVEASRADFTLSGKTTRVSLDTNENLPLFQSAYRDTMVFAQSELLEIAESPFFDPGTKELLPPVTGATIPLAKTPPGLTKGQWLAASGKDTATGKVIMELVQISAIDGAKLTVSPPLKQSYVRVAPKPEESFSLNANVAHA